ncbi:MAG: metallophosphoesterase [Bradymonadaceae bacterium]|nr:metallophosphoesterase [Lujinxingiaceae bacterium]
MARPTLSRRTFLAGMGGGVIAAAAITSLHGFVFEPKWLEVSVHEVKIAGLDQKLDGFVIAHLTDLHLRRFGYLEAEVLATLKAYAPDLVVMTGDMVETLAGMGALARFVRGLAGIEAPMIATLGNWEHGADGLIDAVSALYEAHGIRLLVNEHVTLPCGLTVAGTDDGSTGHADLARTLAGLPLKPGRLFLTHAPGIFDNFAVYDMPFDLALAGHTHGGQVRLGSWVPVLPVSSGHYVSGFYDTVLGRAYVSRGLGTTMIPVRFMCRPELPIFRLVAT